MTIDLGYLDYCETDRQRDIIKAIVEHKGQRAAARALGIHHRTLERLLGVIRLRAARHGFAPAFDLNHAVPPTHLLKGASTLYDRHGKVAQQWVKSEVIREQADAILREVAGALGETLPRYKPVAQPKARLDRDLLTLYGITDFHFGMLAWGEETGADWDVGIAERTLLDWFAAAIHAAPNSETAIFCNLGDFLHADGFEALTPASKHLLDVDTRFQRVVRIAIRCIRQIIGMLLEKHKHVHVIMADANHDPASGIWLREWLALVYEKEPRVTVDNRPDTYYSFEFGQNLLAFHHGHKRGPKDLGPVLVAKFREAYGRTRHHYAFTGHLHHLVEHEDPLWLIRQWRTLAAPDAYASRSGFMSGRDAEAITFHRDHGKVSAITISPDMLETKR